MLDVKQHFGGFVASFGKLAVVSGELRSSLLQRGHTRLLEVAVVVTAVVVVAAVVVVVVVVVVSSR